MTFITLQTIPTWYPRSYNGQSTQSNSILKRKDGSIIHDENKKLECWIEHHSELYGVDGNANHHFINGLPGLPILEQLDEPPDVSEIILTIKSLSSDKAAGSDEIPAELLKALLSCTYTSSYN